ncbi:MAG: hypothetical protein DRQ57_18025 [Gammaproteobacteria bacterium]|nr:MAG: hypothetical protein DRQ57_18025 [Gammaproteobacteria bacterium]
MVALNWYIIFVLNLIGKRYINITIARLSKGTNKLHFRKDGELLDLSRQLPEPKSHYRPPFFKKGLILKKLHPF